MQLPFFSKKTTLRESSLLCGFTDWHCHILPGVDDGIATMQDALEALSYYEQIGIGEVWLTPHILEDIPNTTQSLRNRFAELQASYHGSITLHLSAENMVDSLLHERLDNNDLLPIGFSSDHLLIEFSYMQYPSGLYDTLDKIHAHGLHPVLAHPERYPYMDIDDYVGFKNRGGKLQLNLLSLVGKYGNTAQRKALQMLSEGLFDVVGSDMHSPDSFMHFVEHTKLKQDTIDQLARCIHSRL